MNGRISQLPDCRIGTEWFQILEAPVRERRGFFVYER